MPRQPPTTDNEIAASLRGPKRVAKSPKRIDMFAGALDYYLALRPMLAYLDKLTRAIAARVEAASVDLDGLTIDAVDPADARQAKREAKLKVLAEDARKQAAKFASRYTAADFQPLLTRTADRVDRLNREQVNEQARALFGVTKLNDANTKRDRKSFVRENVKLIKTIGPEHFAKIQRIIGSGFERGTSSRVLAAEILDFGDVTKRRAALIARDQVSSLNSNFTRARHQEAGFDRFVWRTVDDERVRDEHAELDGEIFSYAEGHPVEGFPGEPILCRCYAEPIFGSE